MFNDANPFRFYEDKAQDYGMMILAWLSEQPKGSYPDPDNARDELGLDPIQFEMGVHWCRRRGYWTLFLPNPNAYGPFDDDEPPLEKPARDQDAEDNREKSAWQVIERARAVYLDLLRIQLDDMDDEDEDEDEDDESEVDEDDEDDEDDAYEAPSARGSGRRFAPSYQREDSNPFRSPSSRRNRSPFLSDSRPASYCRFSDYWVEQKFIDRELKIAVLTLVISAISTWLIIGEVDVLSAEDRSGLAMLIFIGTALSMFLASVFVLLRPHRDKNKTDHESM